MAGVLCGKRELAVAWLGVRVRGRVEVGLGVEFVLLLTTHYYLLLTTTHYYSLLLTTYHGALGDDAVRVVLDAVDPRVTHAWLGVGQS